MIVLDPGHGGDDSGAVWQTYFEKAFTLEFAIALQIDLVANFRRQVVLTRTEDKYVPLRERRRLANEGECLVSIHLNADPDPDRATDPRGTGWEIYHNPEGKPLAKRLDEAFKALNYLRRRKVVENKSFYVLKAHVPAVLVEIAFVDNPSDMAVITAPLFRVKWARAAAEALTAAS